VGRASALLGARGAALAALAAVLAGYYAAVGRLWEWPLWGDIAWLSVVLIPAVFLLKSLILVFAALLALQSVSLVLQSVLLLARAISARGKFDGDEGVRA